MAKVSDKPATHLGDGKVKPEITQLGRDLRWIREQMKATGEEMLTREELERELIQLRTGTS